MSLNQYYFREKPIGKGAYATVYQALDLKNKQIVAVKVTNRTLKSSELKLVKKQINILLSLKHPNIISLRQYIQRGRTWYLVLDYCSGGNLYDYLKRQIRLEQKQVQGIAYYLGHALQYLQSKKIAHRDLKLANILIDQKGIVRIGDLGFAKSIQKGQVLKSKAGTQSTMAPEVINISEGTSYTTKCDIWSFGVILYELLFAKNPFYGSKFTVSYDKLSFPSTVKISKQAKDLIRRCLCENPSQRISALQVVHHPWLESLKYQNSQCYLESNPLNRELINNEYRKYLDTKMRQSMCQEYNLAIQKSVEQFKMQYNKKLEYLKLSVERIITYMKKLKYRQLVSLIILTIRNKLNQVQTFAVRMELPSQSFQLNKYCQDLVTKNKNFTSIVKSIVKQYLIQIKFVEQQPQESNYSDEENLIYQLLKKGDNIKQNDPDQYALLWGLIKHVCKLLELQFSSFTIKLRYYQNTPPQLTKQIESAKSGMTIQEFSRIISKIEDEVTTQKMDILMYTLISKSSKNRNGVSEQLLTFLIQTANVE